MTIQQKISKIKKKLGSKGKVLSDEKLAPMLHVCAKTIREWRKGISDPRPVNVVNIDRLYEDIFK